MIEKEPNDKSGDLHDDSLLEDQNEMVTRWLPDGTLTYVNDVFCKYFNKTREELIGNKFIPNIPEDELNNFFDIILKSISPSNPAVSFEHRINLANGEIRWLKWTDRAILDNGNNIISYQSVGQDITTQKIAEEELKKSEERYKHLIESINVITWEYDVGLKKHIYVSRQAEKILGYPVDKWYKPGFWYEHLHPEDKDWALKFSDEHIRLGTGHEFEYRMISADGLTKWFREITSISSVNGKTSRVNGILIDITSRKFAEEALASSEEQFRHVFELAPIGMCLLSTDKKFIKINKAFIDTLGYSSDELIGSNILDITFPEDRNETNWSFEKLVKGAIYEIQNENRYIHKNGNTVFAITHTLLIRNEYGEPLQFIGQVIDITERKKTEQILRDIQLRLVTLLNNLPNVVFYETGGGREFITENILGLIGYPAHEITRDRSFFVSLIHPEDRLTLDQVYDKWNKTNRAGILTCEFRIKRKDGIYIWLEDHVFEIIPEIGNKYISGVMIEISGRKKAEELIKDSLKEKELLIKEIHHRVKNNLQIVSSLLKLQSGYVKDEEALNMLLESQNRIQSMALVHQKLYQSKDLSRINFNEYLNQLLSHIRHAYKIDADSFSIKVNTENIQVDVDTAIPCGLIVNELVTNSLKHAFPNFKKGNIQIDLRTDKGGNYVLSVGDDGIGFPEKLDFRNTSTLGLQLVITLVEQLSGQIELKNETGATFEIKFPGAGYKKRV